MISPSARLLEPRKWPYLPGELPAHPPRPEKSVEFSKLAQPDVDT